MKKIAQNESGSQANVIALQDARLHTYLRTLESVDILPAAYVPCFMHGIQCS